MVETKYKYKLTYHCSKNMEHLQVEWTIDTDIGIKGVEIN